MQIKSWQLALLGVLLFFAPAGVLISDFLTCKGFCSAEDFRASVLFMTLLLVFSFLFVLPFRHRQTEKLAAFLSLLLGLTLMALYSGVFSSLGGFADDGLFSSFLLPLSSLSFLLAGTIPWLSEKEEPENAATPK